MTRLPPISTRTDTRFPYTSLVVSNGVTVDGRGAIAGVAIPRLEAGIADFSEADLEVDADAKTDAAKLLALLQDSPLREARAETLDNLTASGPTTASFM